MGLNEFIDLLGAISPILVAVIAFLTAKHTTRKELQKMKEQWKREDTVLENRDFSEMISAVSKYCQSGWSRHQREAMEKISIVQTQKSDPLLDALWLSVSSENRTDAHDCLQNLITTEATAKPGLPKKLHKRRKR